jgi:hypothetical protein
MIYLRLNKPRRANEYYTKTLTFYKREGNSEWMAMAYSHIGLTCIMLNELENAKINFDKAIELYESLEKGNPQNLGIILINTADYCSAIGDIKKAIELVKKALKLFSKNLPDDHEEIKGGKLRLKELQTRQGKQSIEQHFILHNLYAIKEQIVIQNRLCKKIIATYGEVKALKYNSKKRVDFIHDYIFFCFTKFVKSISAISILLDKKLPEDSSIILYSTYRNYLTISFLQKNPQIVEKLISIPILASKGQMENTKTAKGVPDHITIIDPDTKMASPIYHSLSDLVSETFYKEDVIIHEYINVFLSEISYSSFITSGNYRNNVEMHYTYKDYATIMQPSLLTSYFQLITLREILRFLKNKKLIDDSKKVISEGVSLTISTINNLEFHNPELRPAMITRLKKIIEDFSDEILLPALQ